jgi:hypothetical protein
MKMKTRDLSLASLLCSYDYKMTNYTIDPVSGAFWFHFEDDDTINSLAKSFYLSTATVNVARYNAATKILKSLIHKHKEGNNENSIRYSGRRTAGQLCVQ